MADSIRVLIADDDPLVRVGLSLVLGAAPEIEIVGEAGDGAEAITMARDLKPDVVLMDVRMPRMDGLAATEALRREGPEPAIIVLTTFDTDEYLLGALRRGANGFLLKDIAPTEILSAVRRAAAGESILAPAVLPRLIDYAVGRTGSAPADTEATGDGQNHGGARDGQSGGTNSGQPHPTDDLPDGMTDSPRGGATGSLRGGVPDGLPGGVTGGLRGGATDGTSGGMTDGLLSGMTGGLPGGATDGLRGGVTDGLRGGVTGDPPGGVAGGPSGGVAAGSHRGVGSVGAGDGPRAAGSVRRERAVATLRRLTERERDVAEAVASGWSNAEISAELHMSLPTVKAYVSRLLDKLGCTNRVQIAILIHEAR